MFSKLFSPAQLSAYKKKCCCLREAENKNLVVKLGFTRTKSVSWLGKIIRLENKFYIRNHANHTDLLSLNVNLIENAQISNGLLYIRYLGSI